MSTPTPAAPAGEPTPAPVPTTPTAEPAAPPAGTAGEPQDVGSLPSWAQQLISTTRQEAAGHRTRATAAEQASQRTLDGIAQALGLRTDGTPDPGQLTQQLTQAQAAHRQQLVENAVLRSAGRTGANPDALLDSRQFLSAVEQLDPAAADFGTSLEAAITAAVTANAALAAAPAGPPRGPADLSGSGNTGPKQVTEDELTNMTPEQIVQAQEEGRLRNLLGG